MKEAIRKVFRLFGFELKRHSINTSDDALLKKCLDFLKIDLLIDVGANEGQYVKRIRTVGYGGKIVSLEPLKSTFANLEKIASADRDWDVFNCAAGSRKEEKVINVSENLVSSSLLKVTKLSTNAEPESNYIREEVISVVVLDSFLSQTIKRSNKIYLKIDVQGYELEVLKGAEQILKQAKGVQLEMSFVPLYDQGPLYKEILAFMEDHNFELYTILPEFRDQTSGRMLQADGIFINKSFM